MTWSVDLATPNDLLLLVDFSLSLFGAPHNLRPFVCDPLIFMRCDSSRPVEALTSVQLRLFLSDTLHPTPPHT